MAAAIHDTVASGAWDATAREAQRQVAASFPLDAVCDEWVRVLVDNLSPETARGTLAR